MQLKIPKSLICKRLSHKLYELNPQYFTTSLQLIRKIGRKQQCKSIKNVKQKFRDVNYCPIMSQSIPSCRKRFSYHADGCSAVRNGYQRTTLRRGR